MIALIDYGAGNLTSVRKALAAVGARVFTPMAPGDLGRAAAIVVPGVGHFGATRALADPWKRAILDHVERGRPLLGICLGMQWLFEGSEEAPDVEGLGVFAGRCRRLEARAPDKIPHVGWNAIRVAQPVALLEGVASDTQMYFTHSFAGPITPEAAAVTTHGEPFAAAVARGRVAGVQFHPEKSGDAGLRILRNFVGPIDSVNPDDGGA